MAAPQHEHVDPILTGIAIEYWDDEFVAKSLFPVAPGDEVSGLYPEYEKKTGFVVGDDVLSAEGQATEDQFKITWKGFACVPHARKQNISAISKNYDRTDGKLVVNREVMATKLAMSKLQRTYEFNAAKLALNFNTYPTDNRFNQTSPWSSTTDVVSILRAALDACWQRGNTLLIGYDAWNLLVDNGTILDRIKGSERGIVRPEVLQDLLDVENVVIGKSRYYDKATKTYKYIWSNNIVAAYVTEPGPEKQWFGATHEVTDGVQVRQYRDEARGGGSDVVEGIWYYDLKVPVKECGALIYNITEGS